MAALNPAARRAAQGVLASGGNAVDAFVSATLVEYTVAPGVTSIAGPLSVLVQPASGDAPLYLDGTADEPIRKDGGWSPGNAVGKAVLAPGAPLALHRLWRRFGSAEWPELVAPAAEIAAEGFELDAMYAGILAANRSKLETTPYGRETFFRNGRPLQEGDVLVQRELAALLSDYATKGPGVFYRGSWAKEFLHVVRKAGGHLERDDLERYAVHWRDPLEIEFRGHRVFLPSGRSMSAATIAAGLRLAERVSLPKAGHYTDDGEALLRLLRIQRAVDGQSWLWSPAVLDDPAKTKQHLSEDRLDPLWELVLGSDELTPRFATGSHSFHVVVADCDGAVVTGTHTINTLPWGRGLFVQGVPLSTARELADYSVPAGERRLNALAPWIVHEEGRWIAAGGSIGASLLEAGWQTILNLVAYGDTASETVARPRFGTYPIDWQTFEQELDAHWIDQRIPRRARDIVGAAGIRLTVDPRGDLGPTVLITRGPDDRREAAWSLALGSDARAGMGVED